MEKSHQKHRILVSNDDGIDAPGVLSIVEEVRALSPSKRSIDAIDRRILLDVEGGWCCLEAPTS
jgi:hypothetical protein